MTMSDPRAITDRGRSMLLRLLASAWARWKVIAHAIGDFQARVLLSLFYFVVVGPFALAMKQLADPLRLKPGSADGWMARQPSQGDPSSGARRQF